MENGELRIENWELRMRKEQYLILENIVYEVTLSKQLRKKHTRTIDSNGLSTFGR